MVWQALKAGAGLRQQHLHHPQRLASSLIAVATATTTAAGRGQVLLIKRGTCPPLSRNYHLASPRQHKEAVSIIESVPTRASADACVIHACPTPDYRLSACTPDPDAGLRRSFSTATTASSTDFPLLSSAALGAAGIELPSSPVSASPAPLYPSSPSSISSASFPCIVPATISGPSRRSFANHSSTSSSSSRTSLNNIVSGAATFSTSSSPSTVPRRSSQNSVTSIRSSSRFSLRLPTRVSFSTSSSTAAPASEGVTPPVTAQPQDRNRPSRSAAVSPASTASSSPTVRQSMASVPSGASSTLDFPTPRSESPSSSTSVQWSRPSYSSPTTKHVSLAGRSRMADHSVSSPSVDVGAIEEAMRVAMLDQHRGYAADNYGEVQQSSTTEYISEEQATGYQVLGEPMWNKGLSFTPEERVAKNLTGLIPHVMESLETQCARAMKMINSRPTNVDKYLYLSHLKDQNVDLFYRVLMDNVRELMPLVYTPTIGDVCLQYSTLYTRPEALYISIKQRKSIRTMLRNWPYPNPEICVVTDGSRILGLGDLGINGVGISIGKLSLYTAAAGISPRKTLPIVLDCGTANEDNLKDPFYLGLRSKRVPVSVQQEFMDEFMEAAADVFPDMVVQFEDFESEKAFNYLDRYRNSYKCFNDDIQGTGAVVLGGYIGAVNLSNVPLEEQRLVFMGAGSAGVGVAKQLVEYYTRRGLTEQEAREKFWLVDTKGLVTKDRGDKLAEHKKYFARTDNGGHQFRTLEEVIEYVRPSALIGLTATYGIFTESIVRALQASVEAGGLNRRPILFPLSNPLTKAECTFEQAVQWTDGSVIFASGSPFAPCTLKVGGELTTFHPNQGNNVYIFPGLGLGAILAKASLVTDEMVYVAAAALAGALNADEIHRGLIYPRIERVRDASVVVAREVMKAARREGVSELPEEQWAEWEEWGDVALTAFIKSRTYDPMCFSEAKSSRL